ncbi:hypothetical protein [Spartinivicinus poritis]|uniref:DUF1471 domain-containing protein n=1 Tax=Spartinivicinus poritis TaxID=2994640 RepID=A0ABT5U439_9GAMM|nr:hypothetical protein [Spartinivicinus sp. A2-2]MDE1461136.1 hypothetical protein [Spartinivicinus sp. A2-2]
MKKTIVMTVIASTALVGCGTRKIAVFPEAKTIKAMTPQEVTRKSECQFVGTHTITKAHPNNVSRELKNVTYQKGGNRYFISKVLSTSKKSRPTGVVAELYSCDLTTGAAVYPPSSAPAVINDSARTSLIPGAHSVRAISFAEIENNLCKVLGTHTVPKTHPDNIEPELANQSYMMGGNRYHITKIISTKNAKPTSVIADVYRCKHQSVHF